MFSMSLKDFGPCTANISTLGSNIFTSKLLPIAKPFANNITSESAIDIHQRSSLNFKITGSLISHALSSIIGQ